MGGVPLEGAEAVDMVVVAQILGLVVRAGTDTLDANFLQRQQLAGLADAIAIQITPYTQISPYGIAGIQLAIGVAIDSLHGLETILGLAAIGQQSVLAKQLMAIVDAAIAISIQHQQSIIRLHPAGAMFITITIMIE